MKINEITVENAPSGACLHQRLIEKVKPVFNEKNTKHSNEIFVECFDCHQVISHISQPPPEPTPDNRITALVNGVAEIQKQIVIINNTLTKLSNKP